VCAVLQQISSNLVQTGASRGLWEKGKGETMPAMCETAPHIYLGYYVKQASTKNTSILNV
jgi:hypothetical protein